MELKWTTKAYRMARDSKKFHYSIPYRVCLSHCGSCSKMAECVGLPEDLMLWEDPAHDWLLEQGYIVYE